MTPDRIPFTITSRTIIAITTTINYSISIKCDFPDNYRYSINKVTFPRVDNILGTCDMCVEFSRCRRRVEFVLIQCTLILILLLICDKEFGVIIILSGPN